MRSPTTVLSITVVSLLASPQQNELLGHRHLSARDIICIFMLGFSLTCLSWSFNSQVAVNILYKHPSSSHNQYETCWKALQHFLAFQTVSYVSQDMVFQFLLFLCQEKQLKLPTIAVYYVAIKGPLSYCIQLPLELHLLDLIHKVFFTQCPTSCPS